jgi:hypothetical protein
MKLARITPAIGILPAIILLPVETWWLAAPSLITLKAKMKERISSTPNKFKIQKNQINKKPGTPLNKKHKF